MSNYDNINLFPYTYESSYLQIQLICKRKEAEFAIRSASFSFLDQESFLKILSKSFIVKLSAPIIQPRSYSSITALSTL